MSAANPAAQPGASRQAVVEAALVLLERMGLTPADLAAVPQDRLPLPTFAEYVPVVSAAVSAGTRRAGMPGSLLDRFGAVPDLPWTTRAEMEPGSGYLVMASHLPLKRISSTVRFFRGVLAVRKQLAAADGLVGYTLRARPLARGYWTLSVWKDEGALREFMRTPPHVQLMTSLRPYMGPTKFVTWSITAADGRPSLAGALERLASG